MPENEEIVARLRTANESEAKLRAEWPAFQYQDARDIAFASYEWMLKRFQASQDALDKLITWSTALTGAFVAFGSQTHPVCSCWLYGALFLFGVGITLSFIGRLKGVVSLHSPRRMWETEMGESEWMFRHVLIETAKDSFKKNETEIRTKWNFQVAALILFVFETGFLTAWVSLQPS
jgi:hypothetical protein